MKLAAITRTGSYFLTLFLFTFIPSAGNAGQYLPDQPEKIKPYKKVRTFEPATNLTLQR